MLTPQIILSSSTTTSVLLSALALGFAVLKLLQLYYRGWSGYGGMDDYELVPAVVWEKDTRNVWRESIKWTQYKVYKDNPKFDWEWIAEVRRMGWVQCMPPAEVTVFYSDGMKDSVHEIIKAAADKAQK